MLKKTLILLLVLVAIMAIALLSFFKVNDAPILHGNLDCNVVYKDDLALDIYLPTQPIYDKIPVVVHFHGGAWIAGSKATVNNARFNGAFNVLRDKGYAVISPNYTLAKAGQSPFPACIADAFDVLTWVEKNAQQYRFDLDNVGVMGESAGAHLALMTAYSPASNFTTPNAIDIKYVVNVYGPTYLEKLYQDQKPLVQRMKTSVSSLPSSLQDRFDLPKYLFGFDPAKDSVKTAQFAQKFSPITFVHDAVPPTLLIHGNKDQLVPISQSEYLKEKLDRLGIPNEYHIIEGMDHAFREASTEQKADTQQWIVDFIVDKYNI